MAHGHEHEQRFDKRVASIIETPRKMRSVVMDLLLEDVEYYYCFVYAPKSWTFYQTSAKKALTEQ
ncbi:hypothetical protein SLS58_005397 [Diplodia intermedia]|uniref:Uncharacterized protein n=1 Tax=Diplodia intermedia TaxID=856260 RepID=A0ABR3TR97_9PEZI